MVLVGGVAVNDVDDDWCLDKLVEGHGGWQGELDGVVELSLHNLEGRNPGRHTQGTTKHERGEGYCNSTHGACASPTHAFPSMNTYPHGAGTRLEVREAWGRGGEGEGVSLHSEPAIVAT